MRSGEPSRRALALLQRMLPPDVAEAVEGDLREVHARLAAQRGAGRAAIWLWIQVLMFSTSFAFERVRDAVVGAANSALPSWLDVKLGLRMLARSPLLTAVGCVSISTAIALNAGFDEFTGDMLSVALAPPEYAPVLRLSYRDIESGQADPNVLDHVARWRGGAGERGLETIQDLGVGRALDMSLVPAAGGPVRVEIAEMSASGFRVVAAVPELGRLLLPADDGPGAEPVIVLGHALWERSFGASPNVVGSVVQVGRTGYRVVGVAPEDVRFPSSVDAWVNLRRALTAGDGPGSAGLDAFGRLAPGRTLDEARLEVEQVRASAATDDPEAYGTLVTSVTSVTEPPGFSDLQWGLRVARMVLVLLLLVACANVAILVLARNAARMSEVAVRTALGASRGRIVTQLVAEAMVLALVSTALGLAIAEGGLRYGSKLFWEAQRTEPPAWWDPGMSGTTILYSLLLAALGAAVVGVLPALRASGKGLADVLRRAGTGGNALSFGRLPTAVIVLQIAVAVAVFPMLFTETISEFRDQQVTVPFATDRYLTARLLVDGELQAAATAEDRAAGSELQTIPVAGITDDFVLGPSLLRRYAALRDEVGRRARQEPGVRSVVFTNRLPGILGQSIPAARIEVSDRPAGETGTWTRTAMSEASLFDVTGRGVVAGRALVQADQVKGVRVAVVNEAFVREILDGGGAVGRLVRDFEREGDPNRPWTEIVGVIADEVAGPVAAVPQVYYPLSETGSYPMRMLIDVAGDPRAFAPRLQAIVAEVAPDVILDEVIPLEALRTNERVSLLFRTGVFALLSFVTGLLAVAGIYALMSFIVAQRTREIGIRTALGAAPWVVLRGVFRRTLVQLGLGVSLGVLVVVLVAPSFLADMDVRMLWVAGASVVGSIVVVGLAGCFGPVRRALRIAPTEALRADG